MCLIISKDMGVELPKKEYIEEGARMNKDGIGVAYIRKGESSIKIKKDFKNVKHFLKWMKANISKEDAMVLHFRIATSGLKDEGNRHPFPVTKNKELLRKLRVKNLKYIVAHNGVLYDYSGHDTFSDTQKFILDILSEKHIKNNLKDKTIQRLLTSYITGDRLAILNYKKEIIRIGDWHEENGAYYSNKSYIPIKRYGYHDYGYLDNYNYGYGGYGTAKSDKRKSNKTLLNFYKRNGYRLCEECGEWALKFKYIKKDKDTKEVCISCAKRIMKENAKGMCWFCGISCSEDELSEPWMDDFKVCERCKERAGRIQK